MDKSESKLPHHVSASCEGETCSMCGKPATHKVGEEIAWDDPMKMRHNFTAYVCCEHFRAILGPAVPCAPTSAAQTEREAFEAWVKDCPIRVEKLPLDRYMANDGYKDARTYSVFYGWKSRAALAAPAQHHINDAVEMVTPSTHSADVSKNSAEIDTLTDLLIAGLAVLKGHMRTEMHGKKIIEFDAETLIDFARAVLAAAQGEKNNG